MTFKAPSARLAATKPSLVRKKLRSRSAVALAKEPWADKESAVRMLKKIGVLEQDGSVAEPYPELVQL